MVGSPAGVGALRGRRIESYEVVALLAVGGSAEIYLARLIGVDDFEHFVVLKCLHGHLCDDAAFVAMLRDEARVLAQLDHPNIVQAIEFGVVDGRFFLALELLDGLSLAAVVRRASERMPAGRLPVEIALNVIAQACGGLHHAHECHGDGGSLGLVHRDVSPQNLIVGFDGVVRLIDFGIARWDSSKRETRTRPGTIKGKFAYMSPEQCTGGAVDRRSDVFSLGVVMYELVTGRRLFRRASPYETFEAAIACDVPPPSRVDAALDAIVLHALAKDPARRFATADELGDAIVGYLHARKISESPGEIARFLATNFRAEIDEHAAQLRACGAGSALDSRPGLPWDVAETDPTTHDDQLLERVRLEPAPAAAASIATGPRSPTLVTAAPAARVVGSYRLQHVLGQGGMGTVYAAEHVVLGRQVAIKILDATHGTTAETVERFLNEARALTAIHHPGIVDIYDVGWTGDRNEPFIAMELLRGQTLRARLAHRRMLPSIALAIARQIASVLVAAHAAGIIHRDLKPDNIFLIADEDVHVGERVKLLDFGIAKLTALSKITTLAGVVMGTPAYMAPEQARALPIDARADLYSLGCILFELFAGQPPFLGASPAEVLSAQLHAASPRLRALAGNVPDAVDELVSRLLAKHPDARVQTATEVARLLDAAAAAGVAPVSVAELSTMVGGAPTRDAPPPLELPAAFPGLAMTEAPTAVGPRALTVTAERRRTTVATFFGSALRWAGRQPGDPRELGTSAPRFEAVVAAMPPAMRSDADSITTFLRANFSSATAVRHRVVELAQPPLPRSDERRFYGVFVSRDGAEHASALATQVFTAAIKPLEDQLNGQVSDRASVIIALLDTPDLAPGVWREILRPRQGPEPIVTVVYVRDLRKLPDDRHRRRFLAQRLEAATNARPLDVLPALLDSTGFAGNRRFVEQLIARLRSGQSVVVSGIAGSGKTSLVNVAYLGIDATKCVRIGCASQKGSVAAFCQVVARKLGGVPGEGSPLRVALGDAVRAFAAASEANAAAPLPIVERPVLILEKADWLVALAAGKGDASEVDAARSFWAELAELAESHVVVIVTAVRGFLLARPELVGWQNPFASRLRSIELRGLTSEGTDRQASQLSAWARVDFDDAALARLHAWSGGYIRWARQICAALLDEARDRGSQMAASRVITAPDVDRVAHGLVDSDTDFRTSLLPILTPEERAVLQAVARTRPHSLRQLRARVADEVEDAAVGEALEFLHHLGLVVKRDGRETVPIELLAAWLAVHGTSHPEVRLRRRDRWRKLVAFAAAGGAMVVSVQAWRSHARVATSAELRRDDCVFRFKYPERAAQGERVTVFVLRDCAGPAESSLVLGEIRSTVATIDQRPLKFTKRGSHSERADVAITLDQPDDLGESYRFALELEHAGPGIPPIGEVEIAHDSVAGLRHMLEGGASIAAAALGVLALFAALPQRMLDALRPLLALVARRRRPSGTDRADVAASDEVPQLKAG